MSKLHKNFLSVTLHYDYDYPCIDSTTASHTFKPSNKKDVYIPLYGEYHFKIKYTHSIHLSDVVESYKITPTQKIQQYELMYEDFSIGMPSNAEEGETFEEINGSYYIKNMDRVSFLLFTNRTGPCESYRNI